MAVKAGQCLFLVVVHLFIVIMSLAGVIVIRVIVIRVIMAFMAVTAMIVITMVVIAMIMMMVMRAGMSRRCLSRSAADRGKLVTKATHAIFNHAEVLAVAVPNRHRARGDRNRDILDSSDATHRRVDLAGAGGAIHALDAVACLFRSGRHLGNPRNINALASSMQSITSSSG
jgi:ABC-type transport system involved in cytochrome bd biosynthesis fused ATPase/permease subunit